MSYKDGMAAINLEMPERVPRTEYSVHRHWNLIKKMTGIEINEDSDAWKQKEASAEFRKRWDYGFRWNTSTDKR